jgi:hypothetical protein
MIDNKKYGASPFNIASFFGGIVPYSMDDLHKK